MRLVEKLCKELGVEIDEKWLANNGNTYKIARDGRLFVNDCEWIGVDDWVNIISGDLRPVWKPKEGEIYYTPNTMTPELVTLFTWFGGSIDNYRWDTGLVFDNEYDAYDCAVDMLSVIKED